MIEEYYVEMDAETVNQDFDTIDLYGEKIEDNNEDVDIIFE